MRLNVPPVRGPRDQGISARDRSRSSRRRSRSYQILVFRRAHAHYIRDMRRRRRLYRIIALPLSLWFVALSTDVGDLDACPMHKAMDRDMAVAMANMAMGSTPMAMPAPNAPAAPDQHGPMPCTCLGVCCGCTMAPIASSPATPALPLVVVEDAVLVERAQRPLAAPTPHRLPPSIGPPALHIV
jgi:hypothetical protein